MVITYLNVIDPDLISSSQSDGITTPNILRVQLSDVDVLDDDVAHSGGEIETGAFNDTRGPRANQGLVRGDDDRVQASLVISDRGGWRTGLVVAAPVVLVDSRLAAGVGAPRSASGARDS